MEASANLELLQLASRLHQAWGPVQEMPWGKYQAWHQTGSVLNPV